MCISTNGYVNSSNKTDANRARCVRGAVLPASAFTEASVSGKVLVQTDTTTGPCMDEGKERSGVELAGCPQLLRNPGLRRDATGGFPTLEELKTLIGDTGYNPAAHSPELHPILLVIPRPVWTVPL